MLIEKMKHFIFLLEKSEAEIRIFSPEIYECFADNDQNTVNQIKSEMNWVILSYKKCKDKINSLIANDLSDPLFEGNQLSCIETALFDSGIGETEIKTVLMNLKNAKKDIAK